MPGAKRLPGFTRTQLPHWEYLSGYSITNPNNQAVILPSEAAIVEIDSEDDKTYYAINSIQCDASAPGYVPANGGRIIGPLSNLNSLHVHGTASICHLQFFKEV